MCGLDCSRVDFLQLWEGGGEELEADAEGETDWTWRQQEEETGRQRQLDNERTRLWVCGRQEEYVLPHPPTTTCQYISIRLPMLSVQVGSGGTHIDTGVAKPRPTDD